ncbi:UPF0489 family protein [Ureibacillus sp. FSL W7-1570]|uniref:UPF0489 family protein n=1 Tax=Ureibacillus sp. FSL W7-1570 TaxID=2954593 RepID=UPI00315AA447
MTWREDDKWKVVFPEQKIFLMKHHNWAFVAWDLARDKGWIQNNAKLFHVDQHLDAVNDGAMVPGLLQAKGLKELSSLTESKLGNETIVGIDNFIWAGFARETIQTIVYVSPEDKDGLFDQESHSLYLQKHLPKKRIEKLWGIHWDSIEMLEFAKEMNLMNSYTEGHSLILDLDLDFFAFQSKTESGHTCYILKDTEEIRRDLRSLREMYSWDVITVALSPEHWYIGGPDNAEYVLKLFLEEFQVDLSQGRDWSVLEENL